MHLWVLNAIFPDRRKNVKLCVNTEARKLWWNPTKITVYHKTKKIAGHYFYAGRVIMIKLVGRFGYIITFSTAM